jgi:hypothetical protein
MQFPAVLVFKEVDRAEKRFYSSKQSASQTLFLQINFQP